MEPVEPTTFQTVCAVVSCFAGLASIVAAILATYWSSRARKCEVVKAGIHVMENKA